MADEVLEPEEDVVETPRELTPQEKHGPVLDIMGQQATGVVDLDESAYDPAFQTEQPSEILEPDLLEPVQRQIQPVTALTDVGEVATPTAEAKAASIDSVERSFTQLPVDIEGVQGSITSNATVDLSQIVDERTKQQMLERGSLAEAKTQTLAQEATVQFQLESLYESLEEGKPLPGWASKNVRRVQDIMNSRGLGDSSIAAAAMVQAIAESAIPIAVQDANKYATIQIQNLNNEQQTALSNAGVIASMDKQNLDNRMKAAQQNAQSFLQMDMANANFQQQANTMSYQAKLQSLFTDAAAENARQQFNAKTQTQVNEFYDQLGVTVANANINRNAAIDQFNVDQANSISKYNSKIANDRDKFNANMQVQIDQSNAVWRRQLNTANTAEQNNANRINAAAILGITAASLNNLWQEYRDEVSFAFTASENILQRNQQLALTAISQQFSEEMFEAQVDADSQKSIGVFLGRLLENTFSGVAKGLAELI